MIPIRVLIAEDEQIFRSALADLVESNPSLALVGTAQNAEEAIEIARKQKPSVALVDFRMPEGGGPRATREICAVSPETKVLALSAIHDMDAVFAMLRAGAIGYLVKDVSGESLARSITQAAQGQAILSREVTAGVIEELVMLLNRSEELTEELQALDRNKSELVQILSHELRTPVTIIQGAVMTLAKPTLSLSSGEIAEISDSAMRATAKLTRLAGNVSVAARLGREGIEIPTRPLVVNDLLSKAAAEFPQQRLSLPTEGEGAASSISANFEIATRAVVLVLENALELSPEGEAVEVHVRREGDDVQIHISDRGPGIPKELTEHIFEPFSQVDSSTTRTHQGLGIGLYLARIIMKAHRGRLEAVSREGGGSTFVLTFPAALPSKSTELGGGGGGEVPRIRVLIADDESVLREAIADLIAEDSSMELVGAAQDADEAIRLAHDYQPDVAVLDVKMPRGGGPAAARGIRAASPATRTVALSAYGDRVAVVEMLKAGAVGYLLKGASADEIRSGIRSAVEGQAPVSSEVAGQLVQELADQLEREEREGEERRARIRRIREALGGRGLSMAFQPIFDLRGGSMVGVEALARFESEPYRTPDVWFAEAQSVGLGLELELAAVAAAIDRLDDLPSDAFLSVNLSPAAAAVSEFLESLRGSSGERIVIEVTEHAAVEDYRSLTDALERGRSRGLRLAIDDAGAGYASLKHILQLSPDFIKLDVSLTQGIDTDTARRALAKAFIAFASETGADIVAEGIETQAALDALRLLGVRYGQGYYLARPGPLAGSLANLPGNKGVNERAQAGGDAK